MEITYEGYDITEWAQVRKCCCRDTAGNRCDSLDIEFENVAGWNNLGPKEDDQIVVTHNGYSTGIMYVNTILPEDGSFRILATSLPCAARAKGYQSFTGKTIEEIIRACAVSSGMGFQIFGIDKDIVIPYIQREDEGCAAFLYRLMKLEGAALKCINGTYAAIGIEYAQELSANKTMELTADQAGVFYKRNGLSAKALTVITPYAKASAKDLAAPGGHSIITRSDLPARNDIQAGRWAKNLLLDKNRLCESLTVTTTFNAGYTAMVRVDVEGRTDAAGEWVIQEAEHDFMELKTVITMHRCVSTVIRG